MSIDTPWTRTQQQRGSTDVVDLPPEPYGRMVKMKKIKWKILKCVRCGRLEETKHKVHKHRCCYARMHIHSWRMEEFSDLDVIPGGEWEYSDISYIKSGSELSNQTVWMLGTHIDGSSAAEDGVGVLKSLEEMLAIPPESPILPDIAKSVILSMNPATGDDNADTLANIRDDNDLAPYIGAKVLGSDSTAANSESLVIRELGWSAQGIASLPAMGFPVPLGLLEVRQDDKTEGNIVGLIVELVPGAYKGVHAEAF